jgi:hypothetical protein
MLRKFMLGALVALAVSPALAGETPSPAGAKVTSPVLVQFGLSGMGVAPAGTEKANTGHHHLLIDADTPKGEALDYPLLADDNHKHFGGGQTEASVTLAKGKHVLQLVLGDQNHIPHNPPVMSAPITVIVE